MAYFGRIFKKYSGVLPGKYKGKQAKIQTFIV